MTLITAEDIRDSYLNGVQRRNRCILSKFSLSEKSRTKGSLNITDIAASIFVPAIVALVMIYFNGK